MLRRLLALYYNASFEERRATNVALEVNFIFWCNEQLGWHRDLGPHLKVQKGDDCPHQEVHLEDCRAMWRFTFETVLGLVKRVTDVGMPHCGVEQRGIIFFERRHHDKKRTRPPAAVGGPKLIEIDEAHVVHNSGLLALGRRHGPKVHKVAQLEVRWEN